MNRTKRIKNILQKYFSDFVINIIDNSHLHKGHNQFKGGGETHILIKLTGNSKSKINRLEIHKRINFLLKEEFNIGLHALEIQITLSE